MSGYSEGVICDILVAKSNQAKLVMETSGGEWLSYYARVMEFWECQVHCVNGASLKKITAAQSE